MVRDRENERMIFTENSFDIEAHVSSRSFGIAKLFNAYEFTYPISIASELGYSTEWLMKHNFKGNSFAKRQVQEVSLVHVPNTILCGKHFLDFNHYPSSNISKPESDLIFMKFGDIHSHQNYFHFVLSLLSIYSEYSKLKKLYKNLKLCCLGSHNKKFHMEWFSLLEISKSDIFELSGYNECLEISSLFSVIDSNNKHRRLCSNQIVESYFQSPGINHSSNIFIPRKPGMVRSFTNHNEIINIAQQSDFKVYFFEDMSVKEQILTMMNSSKVILSHGASIINSFFMNSNSCLFEFSSHHLIMAGLDLSVANFSFYGYMLSAQYGLQGHGWKPVETPYYLNPLLFKSSINYISRATFLHN